MSAPAHVYPWDGLEKELGGAPLRLLGYGSLLNEASAALTLSPAALASRRPVIASRVRRLFDYRMFPVPERYGPPETPAARAALNARPSGREEDLVNGVLVEIPAADVPALRRRERGYDLVSAPCVPFEDRDAPPFDVWVLSCPTRPRPGLEPHRKYLEVCREGAASFGTEFLELFLATTCLADGVTLIAEWEGRAT